MKERTGGSKTVVNGKITEVVTPGHHPDGDRSRDAEGRPRDARGRVIEGAAAPAEPATVTAEQSRRRGRDTMAGGAAAE